MNKSITIEALIHKDIDSVWEYLNTPVHQEEWMHASEDWECSKAANDLRVGGTFMATLGAKDGSTSFDLTGTYTAVIENKLLEYTLGDGRKVSILFEETEKGVRIVETFEMETENAEEAQRNGWQAMLDTFKAYAEAQVT